MAEQEAPSTQHELTRLRKRLDWIEQTVFALVGGGAVLGFIGGLLLPIWSVQSHGDDSPWAPDLVYDDSARLLGLPGQFDEITRIVQQIEEDDPTPHIGAFPTVVTVATIVLVLASIWAILNCELGAKRTFRGWYSIIVWLCAVATLFLWFVTWIYGKRPERDDSWDLASGGLYALTFGVIMALTWNSLSLSHREQGSR